MSAPEGPQIAHSLGRVEAKLDGIADNLNSHKLATTASLAEHGVRLDRVETDVGRIQTDLNSDTRDKTKSISTGRQMFWVAIAGAVASGAVGLIIQLATRH
ncbi:Putative membrane protein (plasmid) [Amycolatopsis japonica]|uniref:Putative membrane protein n=1 Tax=Amycolatopsis japonica TaxID=208439 RepID=A0A075V727_9PSEU|nr:hypothetical protein [Amycolatopsis japonica]AIG81243.1 Putative membrane protein [Amycolatopsis japonica]